MRIIMVEPERSPYEMELEDSLGAMQRVVLAVLLKLSTSQEDETQP